MLHFIYLFLKIFTLYLFIYFWLCWVFVSVRGLSLVAASGGHSSPRCAGPSPSRPPAPVAEHMLQTCRLSTCGSRVQPLCGMWDLPRPGLEPASPASAGRPPNHCTTREAQAKSLESGRSEFESLLIPYRLCHFGRVISSLILEFSPLSFGDNNMWN